MRSLTTHLTAIDGVSPRIADALVDHFDTYAKLDAATTDELTAFKGIGPVLADRIRTATTEALAAKTTREAGTAAKDAATTTGEAVEETADTVVDEATETVTGARQAASAVAARADEAAANAAKRAASAADRIGTQADDARTEALSGLARFTDKAADSSELIAKNFADHLNRRQLGPVSLPADLPKPVDTLFNLTEASVTFSLGITTGVLRKATSVLR